VWRGIAMRSDKLLRSYRAAVSLAATLIWIKSDLINTAQLASGAGSVDRRARATLNPDCEPSGS
jgi:hypothetical protein